MGTPTPRLLAEVGGTTLRIAWQPGAGLPLRDLHIGPRAAYPTLEDALRGYRAAVAAPPLQEAALAVAGPVTGDRVALTQGGCGFSQQALQQALGLRRLRVLNDFTALALALPDLAPGQLRQVGGGAAVAGAVRALLGPGTGLGVSGLVFDAAGTAVPIAGEGGHATLAAESRLEATVLDELRERHGGHVSAERVLSGDGLVALDAALRRRQRRASPPVTRPAQVTERALGAGDPVALQALSMFCGFLGQVAGNLALTLGARGGVYLGGGIVPRLGGWFDRSSFRARFEAKGRCAAYLREIPCWVIDPAQAPALWGASRALDG